MIGLLGASTLMLAAQTSPLLYDPIMGGGTASCQALLNANAFHADHANMQWFLGYLGGAAFTIQAYQTQGLVKSDLPRKLQENDLNYLIFRAEVHCKSKPDKELWVIANDVIRELSSQ